MRSSIAKFCLFRKIVCRFWRLLRGIGYVCDSWGICGDDGFFNDYCVGG